VPPDPEATVRVALLAIGDELLSGAVDDANGSWLAARVTEGGAEVVARQTVPDDLQAISEAFVHWSERADRVISTGGLGPTADDLTFRGVAQALGVPVQLSPEVLAGLEARARARGTELSENQRRMAELPRGAEPLSNPVGAAPGLWIDGRQWMVLPGVPREMRAMFEAHRHRLGLTEHADRRSYRFVGVPESELDRWVAAAGLPDGVQVGFRNVHLENEVKLWAFGSNAKARLDQAEDALRSSAPAAWWTEALEVTVGRRLAQRGETVAAAESCTGGMVLEWLTAVPGSSAWVQGGVVAYANRVKVEQLGVKQGALESFGAVSEAVARAMAEGVRDRIGADWGISTTGIAGPGGGTPDKPVGTVWIGIAGPDGSDAELLRLGGDRQAIRIRTVQRLLAAVGSRLGFDPNP